MYRGADLSAFLDILGDHSLVWTFYWSWGEEKKHRHRDAWKDYVRHLEERLPWSRYLYCSIVDICTVVVPQFNFYKFYAVFKEVEEGSSHFLFIIINYSVIQFYAFKKPLIRYAYSHKILLFSMGIIYYHTKWKVIHSL